MFCPSASCVEDMDHVLASEGSKSLERRKSLVPNNICCPLWKVGPLDTEGRDLGEGRQQVGLLQTLKVSAFDTESLVYQVLHLVFPRT